MKFTYSNVSLYFTRRRSNAIAGSYFRFNNPLLRLVSSSTFQNIQRPGYPFKREHWVVQLRSESISAINWIKRSVRWKRIPHEASRLPSWIWIHLKCSQLCKKLKLLSRWPLKRRSKNVQLLNKSLGRFTGFLIDNLLQLVKWTWIENFDLSTFGVYFTKYNKNEILKFFKTELLTRL